MAPKHQLDDAESSSRAGGRPSALTPEHIAVLHDIAISAAGVRPAGARLLLNRLVYLPSAGEGWDAR